MYNSITHIFSYLLLSLISQMFIGDMCELISVMPYKYYSPTPHQAPNPNNYERALLIAPPQAIAPNPHTNLLNVHIQIVNKMGFQPKNK
jgi:hypothetical protein